MTPYRTDVFNKGLALYITEHFLLGGGWVFFFNINTRKRKVNISFSLWFGFVLKDMLKIHGKIIEFKILCY